MPDRVEVQDISCPASTTAANPLIVTLTNVVACDVQRLTIRIPPGHSGLTGIAFGYGLTAILPRTSGAFISGDDEVIVYDMSNYIDGPQWYAFLCNLDLQSHAWEVRFEVNELTEANANSAGSVIPVADLYAAGTATVGAA